MPNVLLIEDNPGDALLISESLKEAGSLIDSYTIRHVERVRDAVEILSGPHDIDIILSDITLPDARGLETLETIGSMAADLPILFMTGTNDVALAITALQQGAQDYLVKGQTSSDALARTILYAIERKKTQNQVSQIRAEAEANLQRIELLAQQKKKLVELNRAKDEFISIASHQLRTPATAVKQYMGMVLEGFLGDVDERQLKVLQIAYDSNERQLDVINELLKTARIDSRKMVLKSQMVDIGYLIEHILKKLKPVTDMRNQTVLFEKPPTYNALVDRAEFELVLENIIENASKYTGAHKKICVDIQRRDGKIIIQVTDEGVGIPKADHKRIFDKFTRVDNDMSDTVSGTGLGLYWAKRILKLHKGTIAVQSELGKGSTFTVSIPA